MPVFYANPNPTFQPSMRLVTGITQASPAVVTTSFAHDYITGTVVRLFVPETYGMVQANQLTGTLTTLSATTFSIDIDTTTFAAFINFNVDAAPWYQKELGAHVIAIGEDNSILTAAVQNVLPN